MSNRKINNATLSEQFQSPYGTLELFRQCGIFYFSIGLLNCSDSVALFVFIRDFATVPTLWHYWFFILLLDFGTVPTVWHYLFFYWTLELFWQCGIICFYMGLWNCSDSVTFFCVSMWLWNCSNNLALFVSLLDFGTVPTHTVRTVPYTHRKTNNAKLSQQLQSLIEKWKKQ
jgi:hypothetical protein